MQITTGIKYACAYYMHLKNMQSLKTAYNMQNMQTNYACICSILYARQGHNPNHQFHWTDQISQLR